ncbi:MAG: 4-hydroxybenzoate octaprenyltransferase [Pseudomonadota bacterium]
MSGGAGATARAVIGQLGVYGRLMRLDRPVGIWLLMWPMLWALWIAGEGRPAPDILIVFLAGCVVTRSAGCVINDIADRKFDPQVTRTRSRPLVSGEIGVVEAFMVFVGLGFIAIGLVATLNPLTQVLAAGAVVLMVVYPFMKRVLSVPQLILGAAFAMAIPMAFAAQTGSIDPIAWFVFAITVLWAVIYDTMYAMCDRPDDLEAGIRSTAILFGDADRFIIGIMQIMLLLAFVVLGDRITATPWYYGALLAVAGFMAYQQYLIRDREPKACFAAFLNNRHVGTAVFIGLALHYLYAPA